MVSVVYVASSLLNMGSLVVIISGRHELIQISVGGGKNKVTSKY